MNVKSWHWFDFVLIGIRTIWFISRLNDVQTHTGTLNLESRFAVFGIIWLDVFMLSVAYAVPLMVFAIKKVPRTVMILTEIIVSGSVLLYFLSDFGVDAAFAFYGVPIFMIGYYSFGWTSAWSLPVALLPLAGKLMWDHSAPDYLPAILSDLVLLFFLGFCFGKMKDSFNKVKQMNDIIKRQNQTLENYAEQIERLTLVEERNRLSRDLHDTVGHTLTTSIIGMNAARILIDVSPEEAKKNLNELVEVTRNGLQEVRNHIHQIAPEKEERPLSIILSDIADEFALHTGTQVNMRVEGKENHVSENIRMALVRCLQESMTNAIKHGAADTVEILLSFSQSALTLKVWNNGEIAEGLVQGFGLHAMSERMANVNGTLHVESDQASGTTILCTVPLLKLAVNAPAAFSSGGYSI